MKPAEDQDETRRFLDSIRAGRADSEAGRLIDDDELTVEIGRTFGGQHDDENRASRGPVQA